VIRALIFDLCDTVVRTTGLPGLLGLPGLEGRYTTEDLHAWFMNSSAFMAYERGEVDTAAFFAALRAGLQIEVDDDELSRVFEALILHEIEGVPALLRRLEMSYPLYALSNNNPLLWRGTQRVCTVLNTFKHVYLSHEIGLLKPDACAFVHVLEQIDCAPEEVVLVDDNLRCIAAARDLGLWAVLFCNAAATQCELANIPGFKLASAN
jgi:putative hydrolase of the HAD superfamily